MTSISQSLKCLFTLQKSRRAKRPSRRFGRVGAEVHTCQDRKINQLEEGV
jgi:hypothetical protein